MKGPVLQRYVLSLAVIGWGTVLVYFYASGRIAQYLAPDFRLISLAGGLGLVVLGLFNLLTARLLAPCGHDHGPGEDHSHETLDLHPLGAFAILLVPLALSVAWTKDDFSLDALISKGLNDAPAESSKTFLASVLPPLTREIIEAQHPADENGYRPFRLMELFFASGDPEMRDLIEGMPIVTEGRLVPDPSEHAPANQRRLYRLFITCCAADSRPVPITARFPDGAPDVEDNTWMALHGTITYPDEGRGPEPILEVDFIELTTPPAEDSFMRGF